MRDKMEFEFDINKSNSNKLKIWIVERLQKEMNKAIQFVIIPKKIGVF